MPLSVQTDDELREFVRQELRRSDLATLVRQLQGPHVVVGRIDGATGGVISALPANSFTCARTAVGRYTITLAKAFAAGYGVLGLPTYPASGCSAVEGAPTVAITGTQFGLATIDTSLSAFIDLPAFWFAVLGVPA